MDSYRNDLAQKRSLRDSKRKCPVCARAFSKAEHLERHVRSHTKEKPFGCQHCGRKYGRKHIKDHHKDVGSNNTNFRSTSALSNTGQGTVTEDENDQRTQKTPSSYATNVVVPAVSDLNGMPMEAYHGRPNQVELPRSMSGEAPPWTQEQNFTQDFLSNEQPTGIGFENWLTCGNLDDSFLHNWPFVIDDSDLDSATNDTAFSSGKPLADLQQSWYTHLDNDKPAVSGYTTPRPGQCQEVDDNYRQSLHRRLQIQPMDQNLPSAEFLNLCVRAYFKRFHPVFPIIHAPTFRPSKTNSVLLLSICSIGSLLTGYPSAVRRGVQLFERLNKAMLSHWETLMRHGPDENFAMIQAALLGQTFGLLSGQGKHLALVDTFHGTIVAWARRAKVFQAQHQTSDHEDLESRWREWVRTEERIRLALAVRIHDAEVANTLHHETFLSLASRKAPVAASDALFFASSPHEWVSMYKESPSHHATPTLESSPGYSVPETLHERLLSIPSNCHFTIYSALEDISSAIMEARANETFTSDCVEKLQLCLIAFHRKHLHESPPRQFEALRGGIKILWHFLFISLNADLDLLEKSIGRDGPELSPSDLANIHEWANSSSSKRSAAHAIMIKRNLEHFSLTSEPAIHVPRAMFFSAICLFCYSKYGDRAGDHHLDFPEFQLLDTDVSAVLQEANGRRNGGDFEIGPLYGLVDLLQRIGHWEISRKFASILGVLIHAESS